VIQCPCATNNQINPWSHQQERGGRGKTLQNIAYRPLPAANESFVRAERPKVRSKCTERKGSQIWIPCDWKTPKGSCAERNLAYCLKSRAIQERCIRCIRCNVATSEECAAAMEAEAEETVQVAVEVNGSRLRQSSIGSGTISHTRAGLVNVRVQLK
jgi:hypothetical protein